MTRSEIIAFCERVARNEVSHIPSVWRSLIAMTYETETGRAVRCHCPDAIKDAAIELAIKNRQDGAKDKNVQRVGGRPRKRSRDKG